MRSKSISDAWGHTVRVMVLAWVIISFSSLLVGFFLGKTWLVAAGLATGISGVLLLVTALANRFAVFHSDYLMAIMMGSYLIKLLALILALTLAKGSLAVEPRMLVVTLLAQILIMVGVETWTLWSARLAIGAPIVSDDGFEK
ncbi:MAG: hypothetical protein SOS98_02915 [Varibaculum sp.]|nr:hypothetical protein [Varibaculum sp.]